MKTVALSSVGAVLLGLITPTFAAPAVLEARTAPFHIIVTDPNVQTLVPVFLTCNGSTTSVRGSAATYALSSAAELTCTEPVNTGPTAPPPVGFPSDLGGPFATYYSEGGITTSFSVDKDNQIVFVNDKIGKAQWIARPTGMGTVYGYFGGITTEDYVVVTLAAEFTATTGPVSV